MREITQDETNAHYAAVGRVAATWASFEHELQSQIWDLAAIPNPVGACVTSQIGNSARLVDCLIALLALHGVHKDDLKPMREFSEKVGRKQRTRNRIVHDAWYLHFADDETPPKAYRLEISAVKEPIFGPIPHATEDVDKFVNEIILLKHRLRRLIQVARAATSP
jgi:hypothetical protein